MPGVAKAALSISLPRRRDYVTKKPALKFCGAGDNRDFVRSEQPKRKTTVLELPSLVPYSKEIAQRVADSRGLCIAAVEFAALWLKTVVFARVCEQKAWILTDASRKCAEARRIDARPFRAIGTLAERKSHSVAGSCKKLADGNFAPCLR
jgi:hypothetical protein